MPGFINSTYEIIEKLGFGGGGNVYLANHLRLGKKVVLKADKRKISAPPELLRREVDVLKDLSHQYIPQVYDFFVEDDIVYTVMDYIEGESLDRPLKRGEKYPQAQVIQWAKQLLQALDYLHSPIHGEPPRGFVHSDIKPANIMRTPNNDIRLIDFNIALALGEQTVIGQSAGYSSPEHYGLDFSFDSEQDVDDNETIIMEDEDVTIAEVNDRGNRKIIVPDVRSDIYSLGATLYHLLSGIRPAKNAKDVKKLSDEEFSSLVVKIITKAMDPNPDLRYQTAEDMLYDFEHLWENDTRVIKSKRAKRTICAVFSILLAAGAICSFTGLKRMQTTESWLKLAEYSQNALTEGDTTAAINYALQAFPEKRGIFTPDYTAEAQKVLTDALGVYDLSDDFKTYKTITLPSAPLNMTISPNGTRAVCIYSEKAAVIDTETAKIIAELKADKSALSEAEFIDDDTIIYAADGGIAVYDIEDGKERWKGKPATAICVSADGKTAVAIYKDEAFATIYDIGTGEEKYTVDFNGKSQSVIENDIFANPNNMLLAVNSDATFLTVSFSDGSLRLFDLSTSVAYEICSEDSGYSHFEGGFSGEYFAYSASNDSISVFETIDLSTLESFGDDFDKFVSVKADESGIYFQSVNRLVQIDPITRQQTALVDACEDIQTFALSDKHTLIGTKSGVAFYDRSAIKLSDHRVDFSTDFFGISNDTALIGSRDSPIIRIMKYENNNDSEVFTYDPSYEHDESRISADGKTIMLFSYYSFRVYGIDGELINETDIPNAEQVYDQQFIREGNESHFEVTYNNGTVNVYNARDGSIIEERSGTPPDEMMTEEFFTDSLRIESPLHGTPTAYDIRSGKKVKELEKDAYLTYVTQVGEYIITQYITIEGSSYGLLLNNKCETLAELPYLTDIVGDKLIFDYPTGNLRESHIYNIDELVELARKEMTGGS